MWKLLADSFSFCWTAFEIESKRRVWFKNLVTASKFILFILSNLALVVIGQVTLGFSKRSATIFLLVELVLFLCLVLHFVRTYHERIVQEGAEVWTKRREVLAKLYRYAERGREYSTRFDRNTPPEMGLINEWQSNAAFILENAYGLGIEYRRRFYEHSKTGESIPEIPHEQKTWVDTRVTKIEQVIQELENLPPQLVSHKITNRIESDAVRYLGTDKDYSDY